MLKVFKYPIGSEREFAIEMPIGARVLTVQEQGMVPCLWALVDPEAAPEPVRFALRDTGDDATDVAEATYVGTFQVRHLGYVLHLWRRP